MKWCVRPLPSGSAGGEETERNSGSVGTVKVWLDLGKKTIWLRLGKHCGLGSNRDFTFEDLRHHGSSNQGLWNGHG